MDDRMLWKDEDLANFTGEQIENPGRRAAAGPVQGASIRPDSAV